MEILNEKHIDLTGKVDAFFRWYYDTKYAYSTIEVYEREIECLSIFVESFAEWFEKTIEETDEKEKVIELFAEYVANLDSKAKHFVTPPNNLTGVEYEKEEKLYIELLNAVMYRVIERGGAKNGPRRGLAFAQNFSLDAKIPMMYAPDRDNTDLLSMYNSYQKLNSDEDFTCYINYFQTDYKEECREVPFSQVSEIVNSIDVITAESEDERIFLIREGIAELEKQTTRK